MRGEYKATLTISTDEQGSPPLARGIQGGAEIDAHGGRITPACAGNTYSILVSNDNDLDHPRLRGEYQRRLYLLYYEKGSPPLARGILVVDENTGIAYRITPACAGNTLSALTNFALIRDHPRLRGEYTKKIPYLQPFPDLHL